MSTIFKIFFIDFFPYLNLGETDKQHCSSLLTSPLLGYHPIQKNLVAQSLHPQDCQLSIVDYHF